jgi:hypothetical protein
MHGWRRWARAWAEIVDTVDRQSRGCALHATANVRKSVSIPRPPCNSFHATASMQQALYHNLRTTAPQSNPHETVSLWHPDLHPSCSFPATLSPRSALLGPRPLLHLLYEAGDRWHPGLHPSCSSSAFPSTLLLSHHPVTAEYPPLLVHGPPPAAACNRHLPPPPAVTPDPTVTAVTPDPTVTAVTARGRF